MVKRVLRFVLVFVALVLLGALIFFGVRKFNEFRGFRAQTESSEASLEGRVRTLEAEVLGLKAQIGSILAFQRDATAAEKQDFERMIAELGEAKKAYTNNVNYSPILLALIGLDAKVGEGGSIEAEVLRLKAFALGFPEVLVQVMNIEGVKEVKNRDAMKEGFGAFVRDAKATAYAAKGGFWAKVSGFLSRYFTVLSSGNSEEVYLFEMQKALDEGDWRKMADLGANVQTSTQDSAAYLGDVENLAKVKSAEAGIYKAVSGALVK